MVSDSVGETAEFVVKAVAAQFNGGNINIRRYAFAEDTADIEEIINIASNENSIIAYTIAIPELKKYLDRRAEEEGILAVDIMQPLIEAFMKKFNKQPNHQPKLLRQLDDEYFRRLKQLNLLLNMMMVETLGDLFMQILY